MAPRLPRRRRDQSRTRRLHEQARRHDPRRRRKGGQALGRRHQGHADGAAGGETIILGEEPQQNKVLLKVCRLKSGPRLTIEPATRWG
jgi:hypothetical protein